MKSKEDNILEIFFENPTKEWHFEDILKDAKITRSKANQWLRKFSKENLIKKIKEKGKMPYYTSNYESYKYKNKKKLFALNNFYNTGFLNYLCSLNNVKTIILFGSLTRSDWYKKSDIDLFIYGNPKKLKFTEYEIKLNKEIQLFICRNKKELYKYSNGLLKNIIKGNLIKGDLDFIKVGIK